MAPKIPTIQTPEGCKGEAEIAIEGIPGFFGTHTALAYFSCPGHENGKLDDLYESEHSGLMERSITREQLKQISNIAGIRIKSICWNCPLGPFTNAPNDASSLETLDEPPQGD